MYDAYILWHGDTPIGFVGFQPTALANKSRHEAFGKQFNGHVVNRWFSNVCRVVLDPRYRGAGIAARMLRKSCRLHALHKDVRYIEAGTSMGSVNRFNQAAGFKLIGESSQLDGGRPYSTGGERTGVRKIYMFVLDAAEEFGIDFGGSRRRRRDEVSENA